MADDVVSLGTPAAPAAPAHGPVAELKRSYSADELRSRLAQHRLPLVGTKSDLSLRLARRESGPLTPSDVADEFTVQQLRKRLSARGEDDRGNKSDLATRLCSGLNGGVPEASC